jgi:hypothetical protein
VAKESYRPQGPLIIAISIERQSLRIYDANGLFAETPISTGMRGHPTPMGVFSIIQKHKFHRSNIYSGAPMPYMQRITWSGIAIHGGVLPGYPASHGCIRMPMSFAVKMWGWTKMGARVMVSPGEMTPSSFSHPLLIAQKPTPVVSTETAMPSAKKPDKATAADASMTSATSEAAPALKREQAQTADASRILPQSGTPATMSDATLPASGPASIGRTSDAPSVEAKPAQTPAAATETVKARETKIEPAKSSDGQAETTKTDATIPDPKKDQTRPSDADRAGAAKSDPTPAPRHAGQISVFVSRKDSKLYVRQNFAPLFEAPVTIATSDRPLGTHVFTAQADKDDPKLFHWSVVSLPATRHVERRDNDERVSRRRKTVGAVEMKPVPSPDSPAEALDRIAIPPDAMARITDALSTGGSIIVSDQGITAGETGEGTDFIVSLR